MANKQFQVPPDGPAYVAQIQSRVRNLIDTQIWNGVDQERVERWFKNFTTDEAKYFAARVLDSLIYRSKAQTGAIIDHLFSRCLSEPGAGLPDNLIAVLREKNDPGIRLVPVIKDDDPPTKSGPLVARRIKQQLKIRENWMVWPFKLEEEVSSGKVHTILFVDDFLGTGQQFCKFVKRNSLSKIFGKCKCVYAPLVANTQGISKITGDYPEVIVVPGEALSEDSNIFSDDSDCFRDGVNTAELAKKYYEKLLEKISGKETKDNKMPYGFGHLGMTYIFEHASPNASIPLLWYEYDNFVPLFNR